MKLEKSLVYIQPSSSILEIKKNTFILKKRNKDSDPHTIDTFFNSIALDKKKNVIGVLLSGHGKDGTLGLRNIQKAGGKTFVQDPVSAKYKEILTYAIKSNVADFVLRVDKIALEINKLSISSNGKGEAKENTPDTEVIKKDFESILVLLKKETSIDFRTYKESTIERRILKRMNFNKISSFKTYKKFLDENPKEIQQLFDGILINVTEFFRDPDTFELLKKEILPKIMNEKNQTQSLRLWVAGCSTGEEVYSLAIILCEFLRENKFQNSFQIFATDISERAIQMARTGVYPKNIEQNVSKVRLDKYFEKLDVGYKITKSIRDLCLFSNHNMNSDPPFGKLDLISCRNVMIYFSTELQKRLIPIFHFSLSPHGYLWLGRSEAPAGFSKLFGVSHKESKIFVKKEVSTSFRFNFPSKANQKEIVVENRTSLKKAVDIYQKKADEISLNLYCLPGVIINNELDIIQYRGRCFPYLESGKGEPSHNILKLAHTDLQPGLRLLIKKAQQEKSKVKRAGIRIQHLKKDLHLDLEITPLQSDNSVSELYFLIMFIPRHSTLSLKAQSTDDKVTRSELKLLMSELADAKESHKSLLEDYENSQEEISTSNEELQSTNEELQSTNEELETAKEELQSTNEELTTVNEELHLRNSDLTVLGNDLTNLLFSTEIPILMVDNQGHIKRFTPEAKVAFNLISSDIGRSISDIKSNFDIDLYEDIQNVIKSLEPKKIEVQDHLGCWRQLQIRPFKAVDNKIDGVSIALLDIDQIKQKEKNFKESLDYIKSVADTVPLPFAVIGGDFLLKSANQSFYQFFKITHNVTGRDIFAILNIPPQHQGIIEELISTNIETNRSFSDYELQTQFTQIGERKMLLSGGKVQWVGDEPEAVLVSFIDITERSRLENELKSLLVREREARNEAERANRSKDVFLATLSHELRTPLSAILTWSQLIGHNRVDAEMTKQGAAVIEQSAKAQSQLIDDLLDISRIISGKLALTIKDVNPATVIRSAVESVRSSIEKKSIEVQLILPHDIEKILADPIRLQQIVWNLLTNAIKFSPKGGVIELKLETIQIKDRFFSQIQVRDHGKGIPEHFIENIFNRFSQADSASTRVHGGLGLGLSIVRNLVELQGGTVSAENTKKGTGAILTVLFPIVSSVDDIMESSENKAEGLLVHEENLPCLNGVRILFVEDNANTREALVIYLKSYGATIKSAASAQEALVLLKEHKYDVIVSDIAMPNEDGYSLINKVRMDSNQKISKTPAIALTAYASLDDSSYALTHGFQAHIAKPVEASQLARLILRTIKES